MSPVAINGVDKQGVDVNGVQIKQTLNAANSTVNKGVYNATLLETVDPDLAVANIKNAVNIFGKVGTVIPGGTETLEKYANAVLANGATYTPAASGMFFAPINNTLGCRFQYYSTVAATWYSPKNIAGNYGAMGIGDGTNFRILNTSGADREYCLMRQYYSTGTYERARDEQLAIGASWTPATSGFFADGSEDIDLRIEILLTTEGWRQAFEVNGAQPMTPAIGDGTCLRVNNAAAAAKYHVTMRAKLT